MSNIWIVANNSAWADVMVTCAKGIDAGANITVFNLALPADGLWEGHAAPLAEKAKADKPAFILVEASKRGRDLAAQIAALIDAPLFTDGRNIKVEGGTVTAETLVYGGAGIKTLSTDAPTVLVTIGAKDYEPTAGAAVAEGSVAPVAGPKVTARTARAAQTVNLGEAAKVVGVGRGFAEEAELSAARDLAAAIGAEVACSRPIAEFFKWMPEECYIGISGQVLKPDLYLAVGISGQAQHVFGVRDAKTIVSINKDAECLMHQNADYYIVGDWKEVIPALIAAAKA
ncbi:electron transfer flavoprotein subunit alpha/FixB family protein [Desulfovibrio sp. OttesenSCG-928-O18]|nr:electron transfer flavoprotein subunit alpha/FixB family protein [Desulfovibrio sp. OttesenSCG-928-O18]